MPQSQPEFTRGKGHWSAALILAALLLALFHQSLAPGRTLFSNDGPLGLITAHYVPGVSNFLGAWQPFNWIGYQTIPLLPNFSHLFYVLAGPIIYSKLYAPLSLLVFGLSLVFFFTRNGAGLAVLILTGIAAALNTDAISHACWGLPPVPLGMAFTVIALGILCGPRAPGWRQLILAGFAVGMAVMESYDVGAILSLYVAAFAFFQTLMEAGKPGARALKSIGRVAVVAIAAALISAQALSTLVGTQVVGVSGMAQDESTKAQRWQEATQWSLPKLETLQILVPGLFGYRMDTPDGGAYWGGVGRDPAWDAYLSKKNADTATAPAGGLMRHSGAGFYAGIMVALVAAWALVHSFRQKNSTFLLHERRYIWFWTVAAGISLLLAFGRHAPIYQIVYQLPFFSTIRNPIKFLHPLEISLLILFGYGLLGLTRGYLQTRRLLRPTLSEQFRAWWTSTVSADRRWVLGSTAVVVLAGFAWLFYASSTTKMSTYLGRVGFGSDPELAREIARSSAGEAGMGFIFLAVAAGLVIMVMSGMWSGRRRKWLPVVAALVLVADLGRTSLPWIIHYDYHEKYASNPIVEFLQQQPWQHRVTGRVIPMGGVGLWNEQGKIFAGVYNEWLEHLFQYYQVQTLDIIQMPRTPVLDEAYMTAFRPGPPDFRNAGRLWELTNTRYILGMAGFLDFLNQKFDPGKERFQIHTAFAVGPKPGVQQIERLSQLTAIPTTNGPFALFEFKAALPRVSLMSRWEVVTNDAACLQRLQDPDFDPHHGVLVSDPIPAELSTEDVPKQSVEIERYASKHVVLKATVAAPSVLLLNDRYHPAWRVYVNGQSRPLLRCNYIMRGVRLEPGEQTIEFKFEPPFTALYVSVGALVAGLILLIIGWLNPNRDLERADEPEAIPPRPTPRRRQR